jgi:hypothetical protein
VASHVPLPFACLAWVAWMICFAFLLGGVVGVVFLVDMIDCFALLI